MSDFNFPSNPKDREIIKEAIDEAVNSLTRIAAERDYLKNVFEVAEEKTGFDKAIMRKLATWRHKDNKDKAVQAISDIESAYELLYGEK